MTDEVKVLLDGLSGQKAPVNPQEPLAKFQKLLRELFEFDCADLDFGIYRIMNHKRKVLENFIENQLPYLVRQELEKAIHEEQRQAEKELETARDEVEHALGSAAIKADGQLAMAFRETPAGKQYIEALERVQSAITLQQLLEAQTYNHLYTFFSRYWQDGDFISKRRYSKRERYAIPYNGEEVYLYWANHDQYYIKTGEYFTDYTWKAPNDITVHFKLQSADVEQNNVKGEKRFFIPLLEHIKWDSQQSTLTIPFEFRPLTSQEQSQYGQKNQQEAIIRYTLDSIQQHLPQGASQVSNALFTENRKTEKGESVSHLEHHLRQYTRRNTSDFFIHKDLKGFLSRELDFYLKSEVLNLDELERAGEGSAPFWFQQLKVIKSIGSQIIEFLEAVYLQLLQYKAIKGWSNLIICPNNLCSLFMGINYTLRADEQVFKPTTFAERLRLQEAAVAILRKYMEAFYRKRREQWESQNLEYQPVNLDDPNLAFNRSWFMGQSRAHYVVRVPQSQEKLIKAIEALCYDLTKLTEDENHELARVRFDRSLYLPLLLDRQKGVSAIPPLLTESEKLFIQHLKEYWEAHRDGVLKNKRVYLLRNLSRGKGVGFFEESGFYPDFILWVVEEQKQRIVFVEPHGMLHAKAYIHDEKAQLWERLQALQKKLGKPDIRLDAYIISATPYDELHKYYDDGTWDRAKFAQHHILFQERGQGYDYIDTLLRGK